MSEIVCPSCGARYRVPTGAIGPQGRRVHCSACGEVWRARVEPEPVAIAAGDGADAAAGSGGGGAAAAAGMRDAAAAAGMSDAAAAAGVFAAPPGGTAGTSAAAESGADAVQGAGVMPGTDREPRRRRSWRELAEERRGPGGGEDDGGDEPDGAGPGASGQDAFVARLARLRQADAAEPADGAGAAETPLRRSAEAEADERGQAARARTAGGVLAGGAEADRAVPAGSGSDGGGSDGGGSDGGAALGDRRPGGLGRAAAETRREETAEAPGTRRETGKPELAPAASRDEQMAEIRRMLNQLQSPGAADEEAGQAFAREGDVAGIERMAPAREEYRDPLREKLLDPAPAGGAPRWKEQGNYDRDGLMRKHRKRNRRRQVAEKTRRSRGGFVTGFLLVLVAGGLLLAVYAFHEQIIARAPGTEAALREYVAAVDQMRGQAEQGVERIRERAGQVIEEVQ